MARDFPGAATNLLSAANGDALNLTSAWSVAAWVQLDTVVGQQSVCAHEYVNPDQIPLVLAISSGSGEGPPNQTWFAGFWTGAAWKSAGDNQVAVTGAWQHIAGTWDGTNIRFYRGGVLRNTTVPGVSPSAADAGKPWIVGRNWAPAGPWLDGRIAELAVWNAALNDSEVNALSTGITPLTLRRANLRGYWPLFGAGSPEPDLSGNGTHLTITGSVPAAAHAPVGRLAPMPK